MNRTLSWLLAPVLLVAIAQAAQADSITTKSGERVFGTIVGETALGYSIVDLDGMPHAYFKDEIAKVTVDPVTRTREGVQPILDQEQAEREAHERQLREREEHPPLLRGEITAGPGVWSLSDMLVGGGAKARLWIGKYVAVYAGGAYGTALDKKVDTTLDPDTGDVVASKSATISAISIPFGVEAHVAGLYVGGGATYLQGDNYLPPKGEVTLKHIHTIVPEVVGGYQYHVLGGPVIGLDLEYAPQAITKSLPGTGFYGGSLNVGWIF